MKISNWGNFPKIDAELKSFSEVNDLKKISENLSEFIPRGMGQCYGDSALNHFIISTTRYNRILEFDPQTGIVRCESGICIKDLLDVFVPRGWFLTVTPGTKFVTLGGAIASDVHGKNHHKDGAFSNHILSIDVLTGTGEMVTCSKEQNPDLFWSTCGGMGLTGFILHATVQLCRIETAYIRQTAIRVSCLDDIMRLFEEKKDYTYSVAWMDCLARGGNLGRSVLLLGEHASKDEVKEHYKAQNPLVLPEKKNINVPLYFPEFCLNSLSVKLFNNLYYYKYSHGAKESLVNYESFFYPLDVIENWNRIYGRRGFVQYQLVLPIKESEKGLAEILTMVSQSKMGSFLSVLKLFGQQEGLISFPKEGYTLTFDFPVTKEIFAFMDKLDRVVLNYGGRLYLTKDARMGEEMFLEGYENAQRFIELKRTYDPDNSFQSLQSKRLGI